MPLFLYIIPKIRLSIVAIPASAVIIITAISHHLSFLELFIVGKLSF
jgi:hypothetical protein